MVKPWDDMTKDPDSSEYSLETLSEAIRYNEFVYSRMRPHLGQIVLEFGTGIGNLTPFFLRDERNVTAIDIDEKLLAVHRTRVPSYGRLTVECVTIQDLASRLNGPAFDSVVSSNVMEHIPDTEMDDVVRAMFTLLRPGGTSVHWIPAFQSIYGSLDVAFGHVRRYTRKSASALFTNHGFTVASCSYWNLPGFFGWWLYGKILRRNAISRSSALTYDRLVVPVLNVVEPLLWRPFGQSLLIVARKPA